MRWLRDKLEDLAIGLVGGSIFAVLLGAIAVAWAVLQSQYAPAVIPLFLATVGSVFWLFSRFDDFRNRARRGLGALDSKELQDRLERWYVEYGFTIKREPSDDTHFQFFVIDDQQLVVAISQFREREEFITVGSRIDVPEDMQTALAGVEDAREDLLRNIRLALLGAGVTYFIDGEPLETIYINLAVPLEDSLTEYRFHDKYSLIRRANAVCKEYIANGLALAGYPVVHQKAPTPSTPDTEDSQTESVSEQSP